MIKHIHHINRIAQESPEGTAAIIKFAVLSIRTQFETMPTQCASVINAGAESKYVWGFKKDTFAWLDKYQGDLWGEAHAARFTSELVEVFTAVPGLGLAKAGFCAQMFANVCGCLDYLNVEMYGINPKLVELPKTLLPRSQRARIRKYVEICERIGTSEQLWQAWCNEVGKRPQWKDGQSVSHAHKNLISALALAS